MHFGFSGADPEILDGGGVRIFKIKLILVPNVIFLSLTILLCAYQEIGVFHAHAAPRMGGGRGP